MPLEISNVLIKTAESETLLMNELSTQKETQGTEVFKFGFGQSPFSPPTLIIDALKAHASVKHYMNVQGLAELREAIASFHSTFDQRAIHADQVVIGPGSKMLIFSIMACFSSADVLLVTPSWVSYEPQAHLAGHHVIRIQTTYEQRWRLTPQALEAVCQKRENKHRPLLMVLNYPGNPDGLTYTAAELQALADVFKQYGVLVISDEIYGLLHHQGKHVSLAHYYEEGTIVTTGLSKWCGAGGWRLGVAMLPKQLGGQFKQCLIGVASETYSCVASPVQMAGIASYQTNDTIMCFLQHQRRILKAIGDTVFAKLKAAGVNVHPPQGGFYINPDFTPFAQTLDRNNILTATALCNTLLETTGVMLLPGEAFGYPEGYRVARLAYVDFDGVMACQASEKIGLDRLLPDNFSAQYAPKVVEGVDRIVEWLHTL